MKKTLAAVLAAAMALSTATVAFAKDTLIDTDGVLDTGDTEDLEASITYGKDVKKLINIEELTSTTKGADDKLIVVPLEGDNSLAELVDDNKVSVTAIVTEGSSKLSARPTVTVLKEKGGDNKVLQLKFKVTDTYGTGDTAVGLKIRVTVKKDFTLKVDDTDAKFKKGDTYTTDEFKFKAKYNDLNDWNKDMQLTLQEVDDRNVIFKGDKLYDEIGNDIFTIAFDDIAVFEAKLSSSQKKLNLFYNVDEVTSVTDTYPNVDFEFLTFKGNPSFVNSGSMTFNAIGGKNTQVYTFDGEVLTPVDGKYDSSYGTITVKGIKKFGTFVVASEILEVEDEEDNEPVSSAPVVEEPSSSEAPSTNPDRNPSTGAC